MLIRDFGKSQLFVYGNDSLFVNDVINEIQIVNKSAEILSLSNLGIVPPNCRPRQAEKPKPRETILRLTFPFGAFLTIWYSKVTYFDRISPVSANMNLTCTVITSFFEIHTIWSLCNVKQKSVVNSIKHYTKHLKQSLKYWIPLEIDFYNKV